MILHADKGLVRNGKPDLVLFHQLYWTIVSTFLVVMHTVVPVSSMVKGTYPEDLRIGRDCMLAEVVHEPETGFRGIKMILFHLIVPFLWILMTTYLNWKVNRFITLQCPRKRMSSIGLFKRNVLTFKQTSRLFYTLCFSSFFGDAFLII